MTMKVVRQPLAWLVLLIASQYVVLQLITSAQYFDAPRNMQWGTFVIEQPRYLLDAENSYDRVNGFPPAPPALAPAGLATGKSSPLHSWWGPTYLGLFGLIWAITGSFTALELVVPLAAGAVVVATYLFGARFFSQRVGVLAAVLLAFFPNFREMATIAMVEPISALLLLGALWAMLIDRPWVAALLGVLAMLGKIDMIALYFGMLAAVVLAEQGQRRFAAAGATLKPAGYDLVPGQAPQYPDPSNPKGVLRRFLIGGGIPLVFVIPWLTLIYVMFRRPTTVGGAPSLAVFSAVLPLMSDQLFTLGRVLTIGGIALVLGFACLGCWRGGGVAALRASLGMIVALGLCILLCYAAFPGASNNPRVMIPVFPMLMLLVALGLEAAGKRLRFYGLTLLVTLYLLGNIAGILYQAIEGRVDQELRPVWAVLRNAAPGAILTEHYWEAALYARHQAAWFEHDPAFQEAILMDAAAFQRYVHATPIRYVVVPVAESELALLRTDPVFQLYRQLPFGRELVWRDEPLVSAGVREYLDATFARQQVGQHLIYTMR